MQVPKQISIFAEKVSDQTLQLQKLVNEHNELSEKRQKISEIPKEYLRIQGLEPEEVRSFLIYGMQVRLNAIKTAAEGKIDDIIKISCGTPEILK